MIANTQVIKKIDKRTVVDIRTRQLAHQCRIGILVEQAFVTERHMEHHGAVTLPHLFRHHGAVNFVADIRRPVHAADEFGEFVGRVTHGIKTTDNGTHAGTCYIVDGDVHLLKIFQHADMGSTLGSSTAQNHAYLFTRSANVVHGFGFVLCL